MSSHKHLLVIRDVLTDTTTLGNMWSVDESGARTWLAFTCEDVVRAPGVKVDHKTAIPAGQYDLRISMSNRFQKLMPEILHVPMFAGIRIHGGNTDKDTEGCILVGIHRDTKTITINTCAPAIAVVMGAIKDGYNVIIVG